MQDTPAPASCPFCGSIDVSVREPAGDNDPDAQRFRITCLRCEGAGPVGQDKAQAVAAWNRRPETCGMCRFWKQTEQLHRQGLGYCRRRPPSVITPLAGMERSDAAALDEVLWDATRWPMTGCEDWCGEWQAKSG